MFAVCRAYCMECVPQEESVSKTEAERLRIEQAIQAERRAAEQYAVRIAASQPVLHRLRPACMHACMPACMRACVREGNAASCPVYKAGGYGGRVCPAPCARKRTRGVACMHA